LAIARAIVERHGGAIGFTPGPGGVGSSFHVELPMTGPSERRQPLVLVYACSEAAEPIEAALRRSGLVPERCATTEAAVARLSVAADTRAVVLDAAMLDRGGVALLDAVRSREALRGVRVLVLAVAADGSLEGGALDLVDWTKGPRALDRMQEALRAAVASARVEAGADRPCVLHVEDDPDLRALVALSLGEAAEVAGAPDLATTRRILAERRDPFALVVLDLRLPDGSGLDLLPLLGPAEEGPARVVIYSACEPSAEVARGVVAVLAKARVSVSDLAATVLGLIRSGEEVAA
jgi:DNA-binding response OmpR family regulator